jgi:hypothetical protein
MYKPIEVDKQDLTIMGIKFSSIEEGKEGKSPFEDIPCITADITTQEIVELLRESRAGI